MRPQSEGFNQRWQGLWLLTPYLHHTSSHFSPCHIITYHHTIPYTTAMPYHTISHQRQRWQGLWLLTPCLHHTSSVIPPYYTIKYQHTTIPYHTIQYCYTIPCIPWQTRDKDDTVIKTGLWLLTPYLDHTSSQVSHHTIPKHDSTIPYHTLLLCHTIPYHTKDKDANTILRSHFLTGFPDCKSIVDINSQIYVHIALYLDGLQQNFSSRHTFSFKILPEETICVQLCLMFSDVSMICQNIFIKS